MGLLLLDTENADRDISSQVTVLTKTVTGAKLCQARIDLGDGSKNLSGLGGDYEIVATVGGQTIQPSPQVVTFDTAVRSSLWTNPFPVKDGEEVIIKITSPNAGETDVDCTATLFDVGPINIDSSGYVTLASTGLDQLSVTDPGGVATTFRQMVVQLWRRFFKKTTQDDSELKTYADNGTTVNTTQTVSDDGTTQTVGAAT